MPKRQEHEKGCRNHGECSCSRVQQAKQKTTSRYGWQPIPRRRRNGGKDSMDKEEKTDILASSSPLSQPPKSLSSDQSQTTSNAPLTFSSILSSSTDIIYRAHEDIERLFLQAALGLQNLPPGTDEAITLSYHDFSNCSSRALTPPSMPSSVPKTSNSPKPTKTPCSTPDYSSERLTPKSSGSATPTASFLLKQPPNTPNYDVFFKPPGDNKSDRSYRQSNAKTAAMCLLQGLGLMGKTMIHRSPANSVRLKVDKELAEDTTGEEIVPVKDERLASFPEAYRLNLMNNSNTNVNIDKVSNANSISNAAITTNVSDDGLDVIVRMRLKVGKYETKPVQLIFRCDENENRPVEFLIDEQKVWTDQNHKSKLGDKRNQ